MERFKVGSGVVQPPVQVDQRLADRRHAGDELRDLCGGCGRLGKDLSEVGDQTGIGIRREILGVSRNAR